MKFALTRCVTIRLLVLYCGLTIVVPDILPAQSPGNAPVLRLSDCVAYAQREQPELRAARLNRPLAIENNRIAVAGWLPQVGIEASAQHFFQQQISILPDLMNPNSGETREVVIGTKNNSTVTLRADQVLYNPNVGRALRERDLYLELAEANIRAVALQTQAAVGRAFYQLALAQEQQQLLDADIARLDRSLADAQLLYEEGITDKVDYKRATLALNQARAGRRQALRRIAARRVELKESMGFPLTDSLAISYDRAALETELQTDPLPQLEASRRPEWRRLQVERELQRSEELYHRRSFYPSVSGTVQYNLNYQSDELGNLFDRNFPSSLVGLNVSFPLFRGGARWHELERARVQLDQLRLDTEALENRIGREYRTAMERYAIAREDYALARQNLAVATEIYTVIELQYREGLKPYLEVVVAETDLRTYRSEQLNSLFRAMIERINVEAATGTLNLANE